MSTFAKIASSTVGSGGASGIAFSSIPGTYTDLVIWACLRTNRAGETVDYIDVTFNQSTSNITCVTNFFSGTNKGSYYNTTNIYGGLPGDTNTSPMFGGTTIYVMNYTWANEKSVLMETFTEYNGTNQNYGNFAGGLWNNASAITRIDLKPLVGTLFAQGSNAVLYGISNA